MLSRIAENMYWAGRYLERAEGTARLLAVTTNLLLDLPRQSEFDWQPLVEIVGAEDDFSERYKYTTEHVVMRFLTTDREHAGSICSSLHNARENLRVARDLIPREVWEEINALHHYLSEHGHDIEQRITRQQVVNRVVGSGRQISGLVDNGMSRDAAYDFFRIGLLLERADMTTRILDVRTSDLLPAADDTLSPFLSVQWMSVLKSLSAYQMYRRHVRSRVTGPSVMNFLIHNNAFPRSVRHCLGAIEHRLANLPHASPCASAVAELAAKIDNRKGQSSESVALSEFLDTIQIGLNELGDRFYVNFFRLR